MTEVVKITLTPLCVHTSVELPVLENYKNCPTFFLGARVSDAFRGFCRHFLGLILRPLKPSHFLTHAVISVCISHFIWFWHRSELRHLLDDQCLKGSWACLHGVHFRGCRLACLSLIMVQWWDDLRYKKTFCCALENAWWSIRPSIFPIYSTS